MTRTFSGIQWIIGKSASNVVSSDTNDMFRELAPVDHPHVESETTSTPIGMIAGSD